VNSVRNISRKDDENVFKLQVGKHLTELKHRLERQAWQFLENYSGKQRVELESSISRKVGYYLNEFRQRCSAW
ncbi:MAG TPA: hypothetical protein VGQ53_05300, partial [Chitinophagaceae bacterium]|nr:hypothetical protein [Chitinophagaceae bacterium]